jgi:nitrogenase delta subunit
MGVAWMEDLLKSRIDQLVDYVMKHCLWQFHSRKWDREKQNEGILMKTMQILCDEPVEKDTPADRCYWVDAICLAEAYQKTYPWVNTLSREELKAVMLGVKDRMDYLTITGSLNEELTVPLY